MNGIYFVICITESLPLFRADLKKKTFIFAKTKDEWYNYVKERVAGIAGNSF